MDFRVQYSINSLNNAGYNVLLIHTSDLREFQGWFGTTALYYGTYIDENVSLVEGLYYNIPEAYFIVILLSYIFYIIVIIRR